jgi:pyruvate dehydrogenase E1 component alpha subunit
VECETYRYHGHHVGDINREYYRAKSEEETWKRDRDPIALLHRWLIAEGHADEDALKAIENRVRDGAEQAVQFALDAPYPDESEVTSHVYA